MAPVVTLDYGEGTEMTLPFTKAQPREGEGVLVCEHALNDSGPFHFFNCSETIVFTRPDGTRGTANWLVICGICFEKDPEHPQNFIQGDAIWQGNEPIIVDDRQ